ncbi:MAG: hypothetical protein VYC39_05815 [Myxococcota bacterium]|nr:hypothetical protein [Myxococcota bacterium]
MSKQRATSMWLIVLCAFIASFTSGISQADEGEFQIYGATASGLTLMNDSTYEAMLLTGFAHGLNENVDLISEFSVRSPAASLDPTWGLTAGLSAKLDILTIVPFVGLVGGFETTGNRMGVLLRATGGFDYFVERRLSLGMAYYVRLLDSFDSDGPPPHWLGLRLNFHGEWP